MGVRGEGDVQVESCVICKWWEDNIVERWVILEQRPDGRWINSWW